MSILSQISKSFKLATSDKASNVNEINELIQYSKIDVPLEFLDIIKEKTEIEIQVFEILSELELLKQWTEKNLSGKEYVYMYERIEMLKQEIPKMFEKNENAILFID